MITLEKLLTELKAESLNEIVAGGGKCGGKSQKSVKTPKPPKTKKTNKSGWSCSCSC